MAIWTSLHYLTPLVDFRPAPLRHNNHLISKNNYSLGFGHDFFFFRCVDASFLCVEILWESCWLHLRCQRSTLTCFFGRCSVPFPESFRVLISVLGANMFGFSKMCWGKCFVDLRKIASSRLARERPFPLHPVELRQNHLTAKDQILCLGS